MSVLGQKRAPYRNWFTFEKGLERVSGRGPNDCWEWPGTVATNGYGLVRDSNRKLRRVHRVSYERLVGAIPAGLVIDHLCRNKKCFNPRHLEAVTVRINTVRGVGFSAWNARKTRCNHGHELDEANTYVLPAKGKRGARRICRACHAHSKRKLRQRDSATQHQASG